MGWLWTRVCAFARQGREMTIDGTVWKPVMDGCGRVTLTHEGKTTLPLKRGRNDVTDEMVKSACAEALRNGGNRKDASELPPEHFACGDGGTADIGGRKLFPLSLSPRETDIIRMLAVCPCGCCIEDVPRDFSKDSLPTAYWFGRLCEIGLIDCYSSSWKDGEGHRFYLAEGVSAEGGLVFVDTEWNFRRRADWRKYYNGDKDKLTLYCAHSEEDCLKGCPSVGCRGKNGCRERKKA